MTAGSHFPALPEPPSTAQAAIEDTEGATSANDCYDGAFGGPQGFLYRRNRLGKNRGHLCCRQSGLTEKERTSARVDDCLTFHVAPQNVVIFTENDPATLAYCFEPNLVLLIVLEMVLVNFY